VIKARTIGTGLFGVAIENKLRFSIGPGPETLKEEKRQKAMAQLDFNVSPQNLYVNDVPVGQEYDVREQQKKSIRVANYSPDPLPIKLSSVEWDSRLYKPEGFEAIPDPSWVSFKKPEANIKTEEITTFGLIVKIPKDEKKRLMEELEQQMDIASQNLEFEKAADLRDEIELLRREL
jgi:hypothetical protein